MASLSVKLPLHRDLVDGFKMNKSFLSAIRQNFKMLLLTNKGERVMEPEFGCGLKTYLFESMTQSTFTKIEREIRDQTKIYLPSIRIVEIKFESGIEDPNALNVKIGYSVPNLNIQDLLEFTI